MFLVSPYSFRPGTPSISHPQSAVTYELASSTSDSLSIGTASPERIIAVAVASYDGTSAPEVSSMTIGGVTASLIQVISGDRSETIGWARLPTGTTATVAITMASNVENILIDLFAVYGCRDLYDSATNTRTTAGTTTSVTGVDGPATSVVVAVFGMGGADTAVSWSAPVTEYADQEVTVSFDERYSTAAAVTVSDMVSATITVTHVSVSLAAIAAAVFY